MAGKIDATFEIIATSSVDKDSKSGDDKYVITNLKAENANSNVRTITVKSDDDVGSVGDLVQIIMTGAGQKSVKDFEKKT